MCINVLEGAKRYLILGLFDRGAHALHSGHLVELLSHGLEVLVGTVHAEAAVAGLESGDRLPGVLQGSRLSEVTLDEVLVHLVE